MINNFEFYKVIPNDTIYSIASKYNVNPDLLSEINGLELNEYIYPNQILIIPKANIKTYITKEGDTLEKVAETFEIPITEILANNSNIYFERRIL